MRQFSIRGALAGIACLCVYFAMAQRYGYGRAILCCIVLLQGVTALLFFVAAQQCLKEDHSRNALAAATLGVMILLGAFFTANIVFQRTVPTPSAFDLNGVEVVRPASESERRLPAD